ncbi:N-carbamoylputrescine amidase [Mycoplana sp. MJR14]|uniref:N-carbamoylputrescine amidase n=1 Tax=Mycoplana sp. MJR14 TaxID=3032583 RepID=UPI0023DB8901|nr:N-carbamoylputrescine amidase [Mycoplana sp. MJR14]MDF1635603.1 N-carbamoylputrescine amidase [Mycoplana sp. MJR14]
MRTVTVAATQMACTWDIPANIERAERLVRTAAAQGANIVLVQELFETPYFCQAQDARFFDLAQPFADNPLIAHFARLAAELGVVLPVSYFERAGRAHFNSLAVIDADGTVLGNYRKSHIPDGPGYTEKFYFSPGDTGFRVWRTRFGTIGCGICWDQWFPEAARAMALLGAEILFYPTAIGSEPHDPAIDSAAHWQRVMQGHAAANLVPVVASNRVGTEEGRNGTAITFYGSSFIADQTGGKLTEADRGTESVLTATFDLAAIERQRRAWGLFRDRRPELYGPLSSLDGQG